MFEINKNDKSTVFSICPFPLNEFKPGIYPGIFKIPGCLDDSNPERLVVGGSVHMMSVGGQKRPIPIVTPSFEITTAIVRDFLDGQLYTSPQAHPGICWLQGEIAVKDFKIMHKSMHDEMKSTQKKWMILIVQKTEDDWKKYKNSRVVTDQARFAVRALGLPLPEWMQTEEIGENFVACPACNTKLAPNVVVCATCRCVVNPEAAKKLTFA